MDVCADAKYYGAPSPMVIGIFDFTMMRTGANLPIDNRAPLLCDCLDDGRPHRANFGDGRQAPRMRAVPHDGSVSAADDVEALDDEWAAAIIGGQDRLDIDICSCRHEHASGRHCRAPRQTGSTFGAASVDFVVRAVSHARCRRPKCWRPSPACANSARC